MRLEFLTFTQETVKLTVKTKKKANFLSFTSPSTRFAESEHW